jgi:hypothetical protein
MKLKLLTFLLFAMACLHQVDARFVTLDTGNWTIDTSRTVEIDQFDYLYTVKAIHLGGYYLELEDGSLWRVEELSPEAKSFYTNSHPSKEGIFVENIVASWEPGEQLIFHKVIDRETILIYNIDRDQLFDFVPLSPPKYDSITLTWIDLWDKVVGLSDGSMWNLCQCKNWKEGDPILVAKDTPWTGTNTHILINLKYCDCYATSGHIHPNRVGVHRLE